jgi:hypothetical protein
VCRRCISNGVTLDYAAPYSEWLVSGNQEPTLEEMRKLVVADQRRPPIPNRWHSDPVCKIIFIINNIKHESNSIHIHIYIE